MSEDFLRKLLSGISSSSAAERAESSDSVTDFSRSLSAEVANKIARALVTAAVSERSGEARECELNALDDLMVWHTIDRQILAPVLSIDRSTLGESELEYLDNLQTYFQSTQSQ